MSNQPARDGETRDGPGSVSPHAEANPTVVASAHDSERERYWRSRTAEKATPERTVTGDEWNILACVEQARARVLTQIAADRIVALAHDLGEAEWRVRKDRDDTVAALRAKIDEPGPCYVMADGECISPFKCVHGDGLTLTEFAHRIAQKETAALRAEVAGLRADKADVTERFENAQRVWLRRHARLSEAVGLDPGYSVDATINKAVELARAARSVPGRTRT